MAIEVSESESESGMEIGFIGCPVGGGWGGSIEVEAMILLGEAMIIL